MKQQYVLLRQENDLLNELKFRTFDNRLKHEAEKILSEIHDKADYGCMEKALCYNVRDGMVKGVGGSSLMKDVKTGKLRSDLILDQFGIFMEGMFNGLTGSDRNVVMTDDVGTDTTMRVYGTSGTFNDVSSGRILLQVGQGTTPPTRADINLETPFVGGAESVFFESTRPSYNLSNFNWKNAGQITVAGAGTVNESIFKHLMDEPSGATAIFTMYRDIISPGVPFIIGDGIFLEYTTQL